MHFIKRLKVSREKLSNYVTVFLIVLLAVMTVYAIHSAVKFSNELAELEKTVDELEATFEEIEKEAAEIEKSIGELHPSN